MTFRLENKTNLMKQILCSIILACCFYTGFAQSDNLPDAPNPPRLVVDQVGLLNPQYAQTLESKLETFSDSTSNQILVLIVDDLKDMDPAEYATQIGRKWGIGNKKFNNGLVVLIKPTGGKGQRHVFIAVGYGLEGIIPDATAKMIVDREMLPLFKQKQFEQGIDSAVTILMALAKKEYSFKDYQKEKEASSGHYIILIFVLLFVAFVVFRMKSSVGQSSTISSTNAAAAGFLGGMMMGGMGRRRSGSGWDDFSSGSGGFGGFGGGSFGGGGAGGSW